MYYNSLVDFGRYLCYRLSLFKMSYAAFSAAIPRAMGAETYPGQGVMWPQERRDTRNHFVKQETIDAQGFIRFETEHQPGVYYDGTGYPSPPV
jgi:hypothetical protein